MGIRDRIADLFFGNEKRAMLDAAAMLTEAYELGPRMYPPELLIKQLAETDSRLVDLLLRQIVNNVGFMNYQPTEQDRLRVVDLSRRMYDNDPVTFAIVETWTDFGFGLTTDVVPRDEAAAEVWNEFFQAPRNNYILGQRNIANMSTQLLKDGDFLFVFFIAEMSGTVTLRIIPTDEIGGSDPEGGVITDPQDKAVPLWYRRITDAFEKPIYYPDWRATDDMLKLAPVPGDAVDARSMRAGTTVKTMLVSYARRNERGWPLLTTGFEWSKAYKTFLQDRAAVARAVSMFVDKLKVDGGQKAIDNIAARLQSSMVTGGYSETNPRPAAGATWLENEAATRDRMPLTTGAADAEKDGGSILSMAGISARLFAHWLGKGESFRLATASAMEMPTLRAFNRYQLFWASVWQDMVTIVLQAQESRGNGASTTYSTYEADITQDALITSDMGDLDRLSKIINDGFDRTLIQEEDAINSYDQVLRMALQSIGVKNIDDILGSPELQPDADQEPEEEPEEDAFAKERLIAEIRHHLEHGGNGEI